MKALSVRNGRYYYSLRKYSLLRVLSFERIQTYFSLLPTGDAVLDYGAGDRPYEELLRTKYVSYVAADYAVTHASFYDGKAPDLLLDGNRIPLSDGTVDCVVLTEVLEHLYEPRIVLAELNRVLKSGGVLIGTVPFAIQQHDEPHDYHRYTYYCLKRMFEDAGFRVAELDYIGDAVGVVIASSLAVLEIIPKAFQKMRLAPVADVLRALFRIPAFLYYYGCKVGCDPGRVPYFKRYPLGFSFCLAKD